MEKVEILPVESATVEDATAFELSPRAARGGRDLMCRLRSPGQAAGGIKLACRLVGTPAGAIYIASRRLTPARYAGVGWVFGSGENGIFPNRRRCSDLKT